MKYTPGTKEMYLAALVLVDRVLAMNPRVRLTIRNVHRLFMISVVVTSKFLDDLFYTNRYLATVAGLPSLELNRLEVQFLLKTRFSLVIHQDLLESYRRPFEMLVAIARARDGDLAGFFLEVQLQRKAPSQASTTTTSSSSTTSTTTTSAQAPVLLCSPHVPPSPPTTTTTTTTTATTPEDAAMLSATVPTSQEPAAAAASTLSSPHAQSSTHHHHHTSAAAAASRSRISKLAVRLKTALGSIRHAPSTPKNTSAERTHSYGHVHTHIASCEGVAFA
jgi:hypothetical protein